MNGIKKIVFDIDNTLIIWKKEYVRALEECLEHFDIKIDVNRVDNVIDSLEQNHEIITKEILLNDINKICGLDLKMPFIDMLFEKQKTLATYNQEIYETIEYLNQKYDLVIFTNWFHEIQTGRLEIMKIKKFFSKIYAGDDIKLKPNKDSFKTVIGNNEPNECIMIGDSLKLDIEGALNVGMNVILHDYKNVFNGKYDYPVIKNITELKNIL